jgi:hypothetical protein
MIPEKQIIENIPQLALQCALDNLIDEVMGSRIYGIHESWQKGELQKHPNVKVVNDPSELEHAVATRDFEFIYIPSAAPITQAITRSILQRNPLKKCILWEQAVEVKS